MSAELTPAPGRSACCGGRLWVAGRTTRYWICCICQQPCDRKPEPDANAQAEPRNNGSQPGR